MSALAALKKFILAQQAAAKTAPEQKMLQGFYRGYAGDYDAAKAADEAGMVFVSPQRKAAEYYAEKRAGQTGKSPRVEMILADPASGYTYSHSTMGSGKREPITTRAKQLAPTDVKQVSDLGALPSTEPFWYNPENGKLVRFPVQSTHTTNIMDPRYAQRLGVPPLTPESKAHNALIMGRTRSKAPDLLDLMTLENPNQSTLQALKALLERGDLPHTRADLSAGESLYEGLPLDRVRGAESLDDLAEWKKYARGGLAQYCRYGHGR